MFTGRSFLSDESSQSDFDPKFRFSCTVPVFMFKNEQIPCNRYNMEEYSLRIMMESPTLELFIIIKSLALFWGMERRNFTVIIVKWWKKHALTERWNQVNFQTIGIILGANIFTGFARLIWPSYACLRNNYRWTGLSRTRLSAQYQDWGAVNIMSLECGQEHYLKVL